MATRTDLPELAALAREARDELRPVRGGAVHLLREARAEPDEASLGAALDNPDALVLAGTVHDSIVGLGVIHLEALADGSRLGVVSDLYVHPEGRGVGVGEVLMGDMLAWARTRGAVGVDAVALPGLRHTKNFFETMGLTARAITVHTSFLPSPLPSP